jgi:hypothetical protein
MNFKATDYLITPGDIYKFFLQYSKKEILLLIATIIVAIFLLFVGFPINNIVFFVFLLSVIFLNIPPRLPLFLAIACLILALFFLLLDNIGSNILFFLMSQNLFLWMVQLLFIGFVKEVFNIQSEKRRNKI